jgi:hypothetical protein
MRNEGLLNAVCARSAFRNVTGQKFAILLSPRPMWVLFLAALCLMLPRSLFAAEPILTLAMVSYDSLSRHQYQTPKDHFPTETSSAAVPAVLEQPKRLVLDDNFPRVTLSLEKQAGPRPANLLWQTGKYLTERGHSRLWQHVQPGYGPIFCDTARAGYTRDLEEPSCGYLKLCFAF